MTKPLAGDGAGLEALDAVLTEAADGIDRRKSNNGFCNCTCNIGFLYCAVVSHRQHQKQFFC